MTNVTHGSTRFLYRGMEYPNPTHHERNSMRSEIQPGDRVAFNAFSAYVAETTGIEQPEPGAEALVTAIEPVSEDGRAWDAIQVMTDEGEPVTTDADLIDLIAIVPESAEVESYSDGEGEGVAA